MNESMPGEAVHLEEQQQPDWFKTAVFSAA